MVYLWGSHRLRMYYITIIIIAIEIWHIQFFLQIYLVKKINKSLARATMGGTASVIYTHWSEQLNGK